MRIAQDPHTGRKITVVEFVQEYGNSLGIDDGDGIEALNDTIEKAVCPFCKHSLTIIAQIPDKVAHFRHPQNVNCPTTHPAGESYLPLPPNPGDPEVARRLRQAFRRNWKKHYRCLSSFFYQSNGKRGLVPHLSVQEFIALLDAAHRRNVWSYRGLRETYLPYIFVVLMDFPPWTGNKEKVKKENKKTTYKPKRKFWFRFWFDSGIEEINDLWIRQNSKTQLYRASYTPPARRTTIPRYEDIVDFYPLPMLDDFLNAKEPNFLKHTTNKVEKWFNHHPSFNLDD